MLKKFWSGYDLSKFSVKYDKINVFVVDHNIAINFSPKKILSAFCPTETLAF